MNKSELKKNRLDLEYKFESQQALIFLTFGTITLVGFLGVVVIQGKYLFAGVFGFIILFLAILLYVLTKRRMKKLLRQIERLKV